MFPSVLAAKRAIAASLRLPLAKLSLREREAIDGIVRRTLVKAEVMAAVRLFLDGGPLSPRQRGMPMVILPEVLTFFGLQREFRNAGYFERVCPTYPTRVRLGLWTDQPRYLTA